MASTAHLEPFVPTAVAWPQLTRATALLLRAGWLALLAGVLLSAFVATPALHTRYQTTCPNPVCETLPQPNAATVEILGRLGLPLERYAAFMVGIEWVSLLVWCALGGLIAWKQPRDPVAMLFAFAGLLGGSKAFLDVLAASQPDVIIPARIAQLLSAITLPLILALFPDGRWTPPWTRWVALIAIAYGVVAALAGANPPDLLLLLEIPCTVVPLLVLLGAQAYRYRRVSNVTQRQQTKWVLYGFGLFLANLTIGSIAFSFADAAPYQLLFLALCYGVFLALGIAVTVAILRYRLFTIDIIISRTLVYAGLTAAVVGLYALIVVGLEVAFRSSGAPAFSLLAAGVIAVAFAPLRDRLQRGANRLLYGDRDDPYTALSRLGRQLEGTLVPGEILPAITRNVTQALRLPYAAIELQGDAASATLSGAAPPGALRLPLSYQNEAIGDLVVAPRGPGDPFNQADRRLLDDLARQAGVAVHAARLTADLQRSRERIVSAREEERRRLRRDLHDGLGPQLAALAIQAGALRTTIPRDPAAATELAGELRTELKAAVGDIRRLVHGLRPPALDELGLVGALRQRASRYAMGGVADVAGEQGLVVTVFAPEDMPPLPAAVEVAAYRIADEALANVAKHAAARSCDVRLAIEDSRLVLQVLDDGRGIAPDRTAGVGLLSMRERAEELGGTLAVQSRADGPGACIVVRLLLPEEGDA